MARLLVAPAFLIACLTVFRWLLVALAVLLLLAASRAWLDPSVEITPMGPLLGAAVSIAGAVGARWMARRAEALVS
jgi:hypothetical protein